MNKDSQDMKEILQSKDYYLPNFLDFDTTSIKSSQDINEIDLENLTLDSKTYETSGTSSFNCDMKGNKQALHVLNPEEGFSIVSKPFQPQQQPQKLAGSAPQQLDIQNKFSKDIYKGESKTAKVNINLTNSMSPQKTMSTQNLPLPSQLFHYNIQQQNLNPNYFNAFTPNHKYLGQNQNLTQNQPYFNPHKVNQINNNLYTQPNQNKRGTLNTYNTDHKLGSQAQLNNYQNMNKMNSLNNMNAMSNMNHLNNNSNYSNLNSTIDTNTNLAQNYYNPSEKMIYCSHIEEYPHPEFSVSNVSNEINKNFSKSDNIIQYIPTINKQKNSEEKFEDQESDTDDIEQLVNGLNCNLHDFIKTQRGSR